MHLNKNQIKDLPKELGKLKQLKVIYLRKNSLTKVPEAIGNITSLKVLDLSFNKLKSLPIGIIALKNNLEELILVGNEISSSEQKMIKSLLPNTTIYFE